MCFVVYGRSVLWRTSLALMSVGWFDLEIAGLLGVVIGLGLMVGHLGFDLWSFDLRCIDVVLFQVVFAVAVATGEFGFVCFVLV